MVFRGYGGFGWGLTPAVRLLLWITVGVFVLQGITSLFQRDVMTVMFGLSAPGMRAGLLWQPVTYMFLHASFWHILFNMLGLYFFGPEVERTVGMTRFIRLYLAWGVVGGVGWLLVSGAGGAPCVGASGAVFGVLGMFAALFPNRPITLLVFFVIPVTFRARTLAIILGLFSLVMMVHQPDQIAYAAHLVGGAAGYVYGWLWPRGGLTSFRFRPAAWWNDLVWHWHRRRFRVMPGSASQTWDVPGEESDGDDVDAILDKVARFGLGSLTRREREILERASRRPGGRRPFA
jgi:membrane associated rhomboid family serine protease